MRKGVISKVNKKGINSHALMSYSKFLRSLFATLYTFYSQNILFIYL
jgi:hypothetical protein